MDDDDETVLQITNRTRLWQFEWMIPSAKKYMTELTKNICACHRLHFVYANGDWRMCDVYKIIRRYFSKKYNEKCHYSAKFESDVHNKIIQVNTLVDYLVINVMAQFRLNYPDSPGLVFANGISMDGTIRNYKKDDYAIRKMAISITNEDIKQFDLDGDEKLYYNELVGDVKPLQQAILAASELSDSRYIIYIKNYSADHSFIHILKYIYGWRFCPPNKRSTYGIYLARIRDSHRIIGRMLEMVVKPPRLRWNFKLITADMSKKEPIDKATIAKLAKWLMCSVCYLLKNEPNN